MGFAVLLGLIAYFFLAKAVARALEKKTGSKRAKFATIAIFVLIPIWDIIPGWLYFANLCQTEAGLKIYKTVELGPQYILKPGEPDRSKSSVPPAVGGEINWAKLREDRYANPIERDEDFSKVFHIVKNSSFIRDKQTSELLGSATSFLYYGGWLINNLGLHVSPWECPNSPSEKGYVHSNLPERIFRPLSFSSGG
jgi:hypothetical protein